MLKTYDKILAEIGWPHIYLVSPKQFEQIDGDKIHGLYGIASDFEPVITLGRGLRGRVLANSIFHELGHHLFPYRRHWWIYLYGYVMARGGGDWMRKEYYGHTVDELPPRPELLKITQRAVERFNKKRGRHVPKAT